MPTAPTVFISYSHKDEVWKDRLLTHLRISEKEGLLELWDDQRIVAGTAWQAEIQKAIDAADIGILLISADFLVSDFILGEEIPRMLELRSKKGMHLFPVMVRSCDWQVVSWLAPIQIRPSGARPLANFRGDRRDAEMAAIVRDLRGVLDSKAATSSVLPALHQLPPLPDDPPADFTGRHEDPVFFRSNLTHGGIVPAPLEVAAPNVENDQTMLSAASGRAWIIVTCKRREWGGGKQSLLRQPPFCRLNSIELQALEWETPRLIELAPEIPNNVSIFTRYFGREIAETSVIVTVRRGEVKAFQFTTPLWMWQKGVLEEIHQLDAKQQLPR